MPFLAVMLAFLMGYAVNQASTCAVTASKLWVRSAQPDLMVGFGMAIGAAGMVTLPLAWWIGPAAHIQPLYALSFRLVLGAVLLGLGAVINDACLFGTLARIGDGELRFLALPLGLAVGFVFAEHLPGFDAPTRIANPLATPGWGGVLVLLGCALLAGLCWRHLGQRTAPHSQTASWPLRRAMVLLGLAGAGLFTLTPGWTYADAVARWARHHGTMQMVSVGAGLCALSVVLGALVSGRQRHSFCLVKPSMTAVLRSLVGGATMALGASLVPGGNDSLLLAALPVASLSGIVAYMTMTGAVIAMVKIMPFD